MKHLTPFRDPFSLFVNELPKFWVFFLTLTFTFLLPTSCKKANDFEKVFGVVLPTKLIERGQAFAWLGSTPTFQYYGKFECDLPEYDALCSLLHLRPLEKADVLINPNGGDLKWWDPPSPLQQLKNYKNTHYMGFTENDSRAGIPLGVAATYVGGTLYLYKIDMVKWRF